MIQLLTALEQLEANMTLADSTPQGNGRYRRRNRHQLEL